ncbi:MAG: CRISPR-associated protein Cmr6, partial [Okeania sp. SIO3C4]|nr:CRISPR-associated protein Cmr6 [Okeania sp. SIO3C4]
MDNNQEWQDFLQKLQKDKNPLYELLKETELDVGEKLTIYHPIEEEKAKVEKQRGKIQAKLVKMYPHWQHKKMMVKAGERSLNLDNDKLTEMTSPLQALGHRLFGDHAQPVLEEASAADTTCASIYTHLTERTKTL